MSLKDKVVVITGGAQGIGKEISRQFAAIGAKPAILDLNPAVLAETEKELKGFSSVMALEVDVTNLADVQGAINKVVDNFGRVDILINNAGITKDNLFLRLSESDWDKVLTVNLKGAFNCVKAAVKFMVKQRYGKIINISSIIGLIGNAGQANYAASKAGLIGLTKSLAKELGARNINVNAIAPGYIQTAMTDKLGQEIKDSLRQRIPLGRFGQPQDVAKAALFLASSDADYITGQVIVVDGGMV